MNTAQWEMAWRKDCLAEYGVELMGPHRHYCPDWDYLPIDQTCIEFESCTCFEKEGVDEK